MTVGSFRGNCMPAEAWVIMPRLHSTELNFVRRGKSCSLNEDTAVIVNALTRSHDNTPYPVFDKYIAIFLAQECGQTTSP